MEAIEGTSSDFIATLKKYKIWKFF
jgi:hypothetical protein